MRKRLCTAAAMTLMTLPLALPAGAAGNAELEQKIEALSAQLEALKAQVADQQEQSAEVKESVTDLEESVEDMDDRSEGWDLASRFTWYGDFRTRMDYYTADTVSGRSLDNDTLLTNRLRLNMRVHATDNIEFKGRLAMYKTWGDQSAWDDGSGAMYPVFDGNVTRTPREDSALYVDRAFINWNAIGGSPFWFSIGRRPTTDGYPSNLRLNTVERMATPVAFMDWPFDGLTLGYAYNWNAENSGRIRFCYGRGFESGLDAGDPGSVEDMDFGGIAWDVLKNGDRFLYVQSYLAANVISYPNFQDPIINANFGDMSGMGERKNLGNILHSTALYKDKVGQLNYFLTGGWSQSRPNANGMFNNPMVGPNTEKENGYAVYAGVRYDLDDAGLKFGLEYNWGSEYWLGMSPGHDDIYQSKLATRGNVWEVYTIWDLPAGAATSKFGRAFIRLGYQHYDYDYSGSGDWNMVPMDLDSSYDRQMLTMMGMDSVEQADQVYLTFEAWF